MVGDAVYPLDDVEIRMCKDAGSVCLQGGCGYCSGGLEKDHVWRTPTLWRRYAGRHGMTQDFEYGWSHGWPSNRRRPKRSRSHG
jgi:hypothetical protein